MPEYEMGSTCFQLDGTVNSREELETFLVNLGLTMVKKKPLGSNDSYNRVSEFTDGQGLIFGIIWFINLVTVHFGTNYGNFIEFEFNKIIGSYLPYTDHITLDFMYGTNRVAKIAILRQPK